MFQRLTGRKIKSTRNRDRAFAMPMVLSLLKWDALHELVTPASS